MGSLDRCSYDSSTLVRVIYESPITVVFEGDLIEHYQYNKAIWKAIDFMKGEGFKVLDIMSTGAETEGNPHNI